MSDLLMVTICLGAACILLCICVAHLEKRVSYLELVSKKHDEGIQDLYTRKANRQIGIEATIPPNVDENHIEYLMRKHTADYFNKK